MADEKDINLGTVAEDPAAHLAAPDMNRYWYPPGKTEPELRPEFVNEAAESKSEDKAEPTKAPRKK